MDNVVVISKNTYNKLMTYFAKQPLSYEQAAPYVHALTGDKLTFEKSVKVISVPKEKEPNKPKIEEDEGDRQTNNS